MVIYFSGTGNSRYAAEVAASETSDEIRDAGAYIKEGKRGDFSSQRPWVFVSPTYCWQLPRLFAEFIRKSRFSGMRDAYFILTCGGAEKKDSVTRECWKSSCRKIMWHCFRCRRKQSAAG